MPAPQPMPMPNQVNDARGSNSLIPFSAPQSLQTNMAAPPMSYFGSLDLYDPVSKQSILGPFPQYPGKFPTNPVSYLEPRVSNQLPNPVGSNALPPITFQPQTSLPRGNVSAPVSVPPPQISAKSEEFDLARQFDFININSEGLEPPKTPVTSKDLQETQKDLTPLALAISPSAKAFDNTTKIRDYLVQYYGLPYPWEWYLCLKTFSCTHSIPKLI
jgi:hypothetical protein